MTELSPSALVEAAWQLAGSYTLGPIMSRSRRSGGRHTGNEPGSSLEFHEYRPYLPGDDLRRVDWGVYGRSNALVVRQYQMELSPHVEIHLDLSASMGLYSGKTATARFLAAFLAAATAGSEGHPILVYGAERHLGSEIFQRLKSCQFNTRTELTHQTAVGHGHPVRILISDFMFETGPALVEKLGHGASNMMSIVLLADEERNPSLRGPHRLVDAENEKQTVDLVADPQTMAHYRKRLAAHLDSLDQACRRSRGMLHRFDVTNQYKTVDAVAKAVIERCLQSEMVSPS